MIPALPLFHRIAGQPVIVLGEGEAAMAKRRLVERAGGIVAGEDNAEARLAFVALDGPEAAVARLRARGVQVNVPDRPDLCDFTVPSILDRSPVLVAVGTGGASAGLAKSLRLRLETLLPQSLGKLAMALNEARDRIREHWPDPASRRQALDKAMEQGGLLDPLRDFDQDWFDQWADSRIDLYGSLIEFTVMSDDPEDLTLREVRYLGSADVILHDAEVSPAILALARADAVRQVLVEGGEPPESGGSFTVVVRRRAPDGS